MNDEQVLDQVTEAQLSTERSLPFMLAGNATFTLRSMKTGVRYTFKVRKAKPTPQYPGDTWFVGYLMGSNNEEDYAPLGIIKMHEGVPNFRLDRRTKMNFTSGPVVAFDWTLKSLIAKKESFGVEVFHAGRCGRCGRTLTVPESVELGLGPECAEKGFGGF